MRSIQRCPVRLVCPGCKHEALREVYTGRPYDFVCPKCGDEGDFEIPPQPPEMVDKWKMKVEMDYPLFDINAAPPAPIEEAIAVMVKAIGGKVIHMNGPGHPPMPWDTDGHRPNPQVQPPPSCAEATASRRGVGCDGLLGADVQPERKP